MESRYISFSVPKLVVITYIFSEMNKVGIMQRKCLNKDIFVKERSSTLHKLSAEDLKKKMITKIVMASF